MDKTTNKSTRVRTEQRIWGKIRYCQHIKGMSDNQLAQYMGINARTLKEYDKDAKNVTLGKVDKFLIAINWTIDNLLELK